MTTNEVTTGSEFNKDAKKAFARITGDWFGDGSALTECMVTPKEKRTLEQQAVVDKMADFRLILVALDPIAHAAVLAKRAAAKAALESVPA